MYIDSNVTKNILNNSQIPYKQSTIFYTRNNKMESTKRSLAIIFLDKKMVFIGVIVLGISFSIGVIIGYFGKSNGSIGQEGVVEEYITDQFQKNKVKLFCAIQQYSPYIYTCTCI